MPVPIKDQASISVSFLKLGRSLAYLFCLSSHSFTLLSWLQCIGYVEVPQVYHRTCMVSNIWSACEHTSSLLTYNITRVT